MPFATSAGSPHRNMKIGSVINEPDPAKVLIIPAVIPATANSNQVIPSVVKNSTKLVPFVT